MEGQAAIKHGIKDDLSEQELVDCSNSTGNGGCDGGSMINCFNYIKANGIATLKSYPYIGKQDKCFKGGKARSPVKVKGFKQVAASEIALKAAVGKF